MTLAWAALVTAVLFLSVPSHLAGVLTDLEKKAMHVGVAACLLTSFLAAKPSSTNEESPPKPNMRSATAGFSEQMGKGSGKRQKLQALQGSPSKAFEILEGKGLVADSPFMALDRIQENKTDLCDETGFFPIGVTVDDLFPMLYGAQSDLFSRFHERRKDRNVIYEAPEPLEEEGIPWGAVARLTCKVPVPVLGLCDYKEVQRLALCKDGKKRTLVVQTMGKVQAGRFGEFPSENVYLFSQDHVDTSIRFQAFVPTPTGAFSKNAMDGHRKSLADFQASAKEILKSWT